jgi:hypothetical protein
MNYDEIRQRYEREQMVASQANQANKAAVFDALAAAGITYVEVTFDGYGDSGQSESIIAYSGNKLPEDEHTDWEINDDAIAEIPKAVRVVLRSNEDNSTTDAGLPEAIEALCYALLEDRHAGWEINDGSFGTFWFHVPRRAIRLEFSGRYTEIETSTDTF